MFLIFAVQLKTLLTLTLTIMEKKTFYVVTITYVDLYDYSVNTTVLGTSECFIHAKNILINDCRKKIELGYSYDHFEFAPWEWTYKSKYCSIKCEIHLVRE